MITSSALTHSIPVDLQEESLFQVRLAATGHWLGVKPLIAKVYVECECRGHLTWQRFWVLEVLQKCLATKHLEIKAPSRGVNAA